MAKAKLTHWKSGTPDGFRGGHRRYRLTGRTVVPGVVVESKARSILRERAAERVIRRAPQD